MTLRHAMIDLETMSTKQGAAIVSIGVVLFDPRLNKVDKKNTFYRELFWQIQGRTIDPDTHDWWQHQSPQAKAALNGLEDVDDMFAELTLFLPNDCKVWGNGATFDISILENACDQLGINPPWKFWNVRDCRTIKDLYESSRGGWDKKMGGTQHNALHDAIYQAEYICFMWNKILGG